jgi:hypothetical protein
MRWHTKRSSLLRQTTFAGYDMHTYWYNESVVAPLLICSCSVVWYRSYGVPVAEVWVAKESILSATSQTHVSVTTLSPLDFPLAIPYATISGNHAEHSCTKVHAMAKFISGPVNRKHVARLLQQGGTITHLSASKHVNVKMNAAQYAMAI